MMARRSLPILVLALLATFVTVTRGDDDRPAEATGSDDGAALLARAADVFEFRHEGRADDQLVRLDEPLLRWSNPIRKTSGGAVYLWTREGRPAVAACVYTYGAEGLDWELQSLLPTTLVGRRNGAEVWTPETGGSTFAPVPNAPVPAASERLRLVQMRGMARLFHAYIGRGGDERDELRMLTQPLHRWKGTDGEVVDGAMFGYVQGTDPEVLLSLEAVRDGDALRWRYALARMSSAVCTVDLGGATVWSVESWNWVPDPAEPYITFVGRRSDVPPPRKVEP